VSGSAHDEGSGPDATSRTRLLDAAESLLVEEGYASVTSRRVGAKAGLKPQLVHYYFESMDELFLEVFRRRAEADLARFEESVKRDGSLESLWQLNTDLRSATFSIEYAALANHRKAIRAEIARYAQRFRSAQLEAFSAALSAHGISPEQLPPIVALVMMTGVAQILALEEGLEFTTGHEETIAFFTKRIAEL
jgi:TetR/AcrR family transcriptional regulator